MNIILSALLVSNPAIRLVVTYLYVNTALTDNFACKNLAKNTYLRSVNIPKIWVLISFPSAP